MCHLHSHGILGKQFHVISVVWKLTTHRLAVMMAFFFYFQALLFWNANSSFPKYMIAQTLLGHAMTILCTPPRKGWGRCNGFLLRCINCSSLNLNSHILSVFYSLSDASMFWPVVGFSQTSLLNCLAVQEIHTLSLSEESTSYWTRRRLTWCEGTFIQ